MYLGIDLGGINVAAALVSDTGTIKKQRSTPTPRTPEGVADVIAEHVRQLLGDRNETVEYIGLGSPGVIDTEHGVVEYWSNLDFHDVPLADLIEARTGLPVLMENDAGCAALGEYIAGAGKGSTSMVVITLGTGIGGGIISGGRLLEGNRGFAGEIGHFPVHIGEKTLEEGGKGVYFENRASTAGLVRDAVEVNSEWDNGRKVFNAASAADDKALALLDHWLDELTCGITGLIHVLNPQVVIIGGGVSAQ